MRLLPLTLVASGMIALIGCLPEGDETTGKPVESERTACEAQGGTYEIGGLAQSYVCFTPLPDAGTTCEKETDCAGFCLSETRQCSAVTPQFGCIPHLDETGRELVICID